MQLRWLRLMRTPVLLTLLGHSLEGNLGSTVFAAAVTIGIRFRALSKTFINKVITFVYLFR